MPQIVHSVAQAGSATAQSRSCPQRQPWALRAPCTAEAASPWPTTLCRSACSASPWRVGQPWRQSRSARRAARLAVRAGELPVVRWHYDQCLQLLFIDRSDTVRARFALGMLERVSAWQGCSSPLAGTPCGLEAVAGSRPGLGTQAGLISLASGWQLRPHVFTSPRMRFDVDDIDRFDLLVCLDGGVQAEVLKAVSAERPQEPASYVQRVCCLHDFLMYCSDEALLRAGSTSVLDRQLRSQVALALPALRPSAARVAAAAAAAAGGPGGGSVVGGGAGARCAASAVPAYMLPTGIPRPPLGASDAAGAPVGGSLGGGGAESAEQQWDRMALLTAVCCAGLVRYLLDCGFEEVTGGYSTDE